MPDWFAGLPPLDVALLLICSFFGSLMTASLGVGGGAFLITIMAGILPPMALIPLHGLVQMGSNAGRAVLTYRHAQWRVIGFFALGAVPALGIAALLLGVIDTDWIPLLVAVFILLLTWAPLPALGLGRHPLGLAAGGLLTTVLTVLVGATGPLVSAWLGREGADRWTYTANFSHCMTLQHLLKLLAFGMAGFAFLPWLPLLAAMIVAGYLGTLTGLKVLGRISNARFKRWFKWVLTLLALRLVYQFLVAA